MIVVDTNVIAYLLLPGERTKDAESAFQRDPRWIAPPLWRSELLNVLCLYARKGLITSDQAVAVRDKALAVVNVEPVDASPRVVLELSLASSCSGYDCEFVALAKQLAVPLVTTDQKVLAAFPDIAIPLERFASLGR